MREVLREQLSGRTTVLVTHDLLDVLVLAQHVVVLNEGRVIASGHTTEVLAHPRDPFLANFLGVNVLSGTLAGSELELAPDVRLQGVRASEAADGVGWASFPATAVTLHREMPHGSARNVLPATVRAIEPRGPVARVGCDLVGQEVGVDVTPQSVAQLGAAVGERELVALKATAVALHREMPQGSARNVLAATVRAIEPRGPVVRVGCDLVGQEVGVDVTPQSVAQLGVAVGERVLVAIKATAVALY